MLIVGEDAEEQTLLVAMQSDTTTLEDGLAVSNKAKHSFTI